MTQKNETVVLSSDDLITERNIKLLHAIPILKCNEKGENLHMKEVDKIYEKLSSMSKFKNKLAVRVEHVDVAHKNKNDNYYLVDGIQGFEELIECHDIKNGGDFGFCDGTLISAIYGQTYEYEGVFDFVKDIFYVNPTLTLCESGTITKEFYEELHKVTVTGEMHKLNKMISTMSKSMCKTNSERNR